MTLADALEIQVRTRRPLVDVRWLLSCTSKATRVSYEDFMIVNTLTAITVDPPVSSVKTCSVVLGHATSPTTGTLEAGVDVQATGNVLAAPAPESAHTSSTAAVEAEPSEA